MNNDDVVKITEEEKKASEVNRDKRTKTVRELPVFRDVSNLAFVIEQILMNCPRKFRCSVDESERIMTQLLQSLDMANEVVELRRECCSEAHSLLIALMVRMDILHRLHVIDKDTWNKVKKLCTSAIAQVAGWRRSVVAQGSI